MVSRGQSPTPTATTPRRRRAGRGRRRRVETVVFALYDADRSGPKLRRPDREEAGRLLRRAPSITELLAVTDEQIDAWNLPTRPAKEDAEPDAVELDAIPPTTS